MELGFEVSVSDPHSSGRGEQEGTGETTPTHAPAPLPLGPAVRSYRDALRPAQQFRDGGAPVTSSALANEETGPESYLTEPC